MKSRVIKLLINNIFNIKKINILIYRESAVRCGAVQLCHFEGSFCVLCGLCDLVNTPIDKDNAAHHHDNDKAHHSDRDKGKL